MFDFECAYCKTVVDCKAARCPACGNNPRGGPPFPWYCPRCDEFTVRPAMMVGQDEVLQMSPPGTIAYFTVGAASCCVLLKCRRCHRVFLNEEEAPKERCLGYWDLPHHLRGKQP
jgi:hypothetical protein